ncbi:MAG: hypothetical protein V7K94_08200 [Nostoc sp.]|uniref:hypothetical protein n=1 Tax=Nostoc sp. TaxID=1180 RepID=UPI002FFBE792
MSTTPAAILDVALQKAEASIVQPIVTNPSIAEKIDYVSRYVGNRAVVRLLLACSLAAIHRGNVDDPQALHRNRHTRCLLWTLLR